MTLVCEGTTLMCGEMTLARKEMTLVCEEMTLVCREMTVARKEMTLATEEMTIVCDPSKELASAVHSTATCRNSLTSSSSSFMSPVTLFIVDRSPADMLAWPPEKVESVAAAVVAEVEAMVVAVVGGGWRDGWTTMILVM